jgi:hypothetical protein
MAGNGVSFQTARAIAELDRDGLPQPAAPASAVSGPVQFTKGFTPEQRAAQKAALVQALRKRAAEPASPEL